MSDEKKHIWELRDEDQKLWATVWWDGKSIRSDDHKVISMLKDIHHSGKEFSDGLEFLNVVPNYFRSGYVTMNKVK